MKKQPRKLTLNRETIHKLSLEEGSQVAGGATQICPTNTCVFCVYTHRCPPTLTPSCTCSFFHLA
jgi:hypothetical protein